MYIHVYRSTCKIYDKMLTIDINYTSMYTYLLQFWRKPHRHNLSEYRLIPNHPTRMIWCASIGTTVQPKLAGNRKRAKKTADGVGGGKLSYCSCRVHSRVGKHRSASRIPLSETALHPATRSLLRVKFVACYGLLFGLFLSTFAKSSQQRRFLHAPRGWYRPFAKQQIQQRSKRTQTKRRRHSFSV